MTNKQPDNGVDNFYKQLLEVLQEFHERNLNNEDYPYNTLGLAEWLEYERLKPTPPPLSKEGK